MVKKIMPLILWITVFQLVGYGAGLLTRAEISTWYQTLQKSNINPSQITFPIVWTCLYVMLAIAGWYLWTHRDRPRGKIIFNLYFIQIIMNWAWSPLFFQLHLIQLGFYWIVIMILITMLLIIMTKKQFPLAYFLLIPYSLWLIFAGYLNWVIWMKN